MRRDLFTERWPWWEVAKVVLLVGWMALCLWLFSVAMRRTKDVPGQGALSPQCLAVAEELGERLCGGVITGAPGTRLVEAWGPKTDRVPSRVRGWGAGRNAQEQDITLARVRVSVLPAGETGPHSLPPLNPDGTWRGFERFGLSAPQPIL